MDALSATQAAAPQSKFRFRCSHCEDVHVGLPDVCFPTPDAIKDIPDAEFEETCLISEDVCIVGGHSYYIHCILEVPVIDYPDRFGWGVWCKVSWTPFKLYWETTGSNLPAFLEPATAVLANDLKQMAPTSDLNCEVLFREDGLRPQAMLLPSNHELYRVQQEGLTVDQAVSQAQSVGTLLLIA